MFGYLPDVDGEIVLPYLSRQMTAPLTADGELPCESDLVPVTLSFASALVVPGTEHLLHTSLRHVCDNLLGFGKWLRGASAITKMLSNRMYRDRIKWRLCQHSDEAHHLFDKGFAKFVEHRFLSIQVFTFQILQYELWLKCRFDGGRVFSQLVVTHGWKNVMLWTPSTVCTGGAIVKCCMVSWVVCMPLHFTHVPVPVTEANDPTFSGMATLDHPALPLLSSMV